MSSWPVRRIVSDMRVWVLPLAVLAVIDLVMIGLVLGPLAARVRGLEARSVTAAGAAAVAARELEQARALGTGKTQAAGDIERFYREILPLDQSSARRLTFLRLADMARAAGLDYDRRAFTQEQEQGARLVRVDQALVVQGRYGQLRRFLHAVESGPDFVIVRGVSVAQTGDVPGELEATLGISTYYRADDGR